MMFLVLKVASMIVCNLFQILANHPKPCLFFSARLILSDVSKRNVSFNRSTRCNPFAQKDEIGVNSGEQFKAFSSVKKYNSNFSWRPCPGGLPFDPKSADSLSNLSNYFRSQSIIPNHVFDSLSNLGPEEQPHLPQHQRSWCCPARDQGVPSLLCTLIARNQCLLVVILQLL